MIIAGLDLSPTSSGLVKFFLNDSLEIVDVKKLGFVGYTVPKKKAPKIPNYKDIVAYDEEKYDFYNRTLMMTEHIFEFIKDVDYAAIEGYSYGSTASGHFTDISEFCSQIKFQLLRQGTKVRLVSPTQIKQFATGKGTSEKPAMYDAFISKGFSEKLDIKDLPEIPVHKRGKNVGLRDKSGISPLSDIIDSYHICDLLYTELLIRKGTKQLDDLAPIEKHVMTHTTKTNKIPLIKQEFLEKI